MDVCIHTGTVFTSFSGRTSVTVTTSPRYAAVASVASDCKDRRHVMAVDTCWIREPGSLQCLCGFLSFMLYVHLRSPCAAKSFFLGRNSPTKEALNVFVSVGMECFCFRPKAGLGHHHMFANSGHGSRDAAGPVAVRRGEPLLRLPPLFRSPAVSPVDCGSLETAVCGRLVRCGLRLGRRQRPFGPPGGGRRLGRVLRRAARGPALGCGLQGFLYSTRGLQSRRDRVLRARSLELLL